MTRRRGFVADWTPRPATQLIIDLALAAIADEGIVTPRRVLYLALEAGLTNSRGRPLDKSKTSYGSVIDALVMARRAGIVPWEAVADTTDRIDPKKYADPDDFKGFVSTMAGRYRLDRQTDQPVYLVAWSEHRGLRRILSPACRDWGLPLVLSGGSDSLSSRYVEAAAAGDRDVPTVVLHIGDRDPAGEDIFAVLTEDLPALSFGAVSEVVRVALTSDQVHNFGLGDPGEPVQVDALSAVVLADLLVDAIEDRFDADIRRDVLDREAEQRAELIAWAAR